VPFTIDVVELDGWFMCLGWLQILDIPKGCPRQAEDNASQYNFLEFHITEVHGVDLSFLSTDFTT